MPAPPTPREDSAGYALEENHDYVRRSLVKWLRTHTAQKKQRLRVFVLYGGLHLDGTPESLPALLEDAGYSCAVLLPVQVGLELAVRERLSDLDASEWLAFENGVYRPGVVSNAEWVAAAQREALRFEWVRRELEKALQARDTPTAQWHFLRLIGINRRRATATLEAYVARPEAVELRRWLSDMSKYLRDASK